MEWNLFCSVSSIGQIIWVDALSSIYKELQSFGNTFTLIFIRTLAERKWHRHVVVSLSPGENGREHFEVFHKCTLFFGPAILQYKSLLWLLHIQGIFPTFSPTFFSWRHCWRKSSEVGNHWTTWSPTRELDSREFLSWRRPVSGGRALIRTGDSS